jgi:hypothetical protein
MPAQTTQLESFCLIKAYRRPTRMPEYYRKIVVWASR